MPALASTSSHTSTVVRPDLAYVVLFKEQKTTEAIARARAHAVANVLAKALSDIDVSGEYEVIITPAKRFDWAIVDLRLQPNMIIAETTGRTEAAILYEGLVRIDPGNRDRYGLARSRELDITGK